MFLLDEPLSNLDAKLRASAREELASFHKRVKTTTIYVTHDQVEAMAMGDRIVVLNRGLVRQIGTPREVYDEPADTFVATFLGSPPMNLVDAGDVIAGFRPETLQPAASVSGEELPAAAPDLERRVPRVGADPLRHRGGRAVRREEGRRAAHHRRRAPGSPRARRTSSRSRERDLKFFDKASEKRTEARGFAWR